LKDFYRRFFGCKAPERYESRGKYFSPYFLSFHDGARVKKIYPVMYTKVL